MADKRLHTFHMVAKYLSFTKAAEVLSLTQPAVTFQIRQLEEQFNTRLFDRGHGRISLTPAGDMVLDYTKRILSLSDELEARLGEITGEMRGLLAIGACTTMGEYVLPKLLSEFNARYPQLQTRLIVANSETIANHIAEYRLDIGLIESESPVPANVKAESCFSDELQVICASDYPLAGHKELDPDILSEYEFISREPGSGTREVTEAYFRHAGVDPDSLKMLMELGSPEALKSVVATGLGFAIVAKQVYSKTDAGKLVAIPLKPRLEHSFSLIYPKERFRTRVVSTFIDFLQKKLRS